jgi:transposase
MDKPALKPLPVARYQFAQWKKARVHIDYHIEIDRHYYSVPYQLIKKELDVRLTVNTVECFYKGKRIASHVRSDRQGRHTSVKEHMPKSHQKYVKWTPERLLNWAGKIGPHTAELIEKVMRSRCIPNRDFAAAWESSDWAKVMEKIAWKQLQDAPIKSAAEVTRALRQS